MDKPLDTLQVTVMYFDGQEDDDVRYPYYVASCDAIGLTTDGETLEHVLRNLREALELALDEDDTLETYNVIPNPRINITI